jgi:hypothetical protein
MGFISFRYINNAANNSWYCLIDELKERLPRNLSEFCCEERKEERKFKKYKKCWQRKELLVVSIIQLMVTDEENES